MTPEAIVRKYREDGFVVIPDVIDHDLVRETQGHIEWLGRKYPDLRPEQYHHHLVLDDPFWIRLSTDPRLIDVVEPFLGPDIALYAAHYISKPPRHGQAVLWHQDGHYWPLEPMDVISIWLAVDDSVPENGCMRVIPGTHTPKILYTHRPNEAVDNVLRSELAEHVDESRAVDVIVPAGGVSVHGPYIIHGSRSNTSDRRRCGLTLRYIPSTTRIGEECFPVYHCRGTMREDVNFYPPWPRFCPADHYRFRGSDQPPWAG